MRRIKKITFPKLVDDIRVSVYVSAFFGEGWTIKGLREAIKQEKFPSVYGHSKLCRSIVQTLPDGNYFFRTASRYVIVAVKNCEVVSVYG